MLLRIYFSISLFLLACSLNAQVKKGEKLLEERDYTAAMTAFQQPTKGGLEATRALLGQAKVYANSRYEGYDPVQAYKIAYELIEERKALPKSEQDKLEKKLPLGDIRRVAIGVESQQLRQLKKQDDPAAYDDFLATYTHLADRKVASATELRNELALKKIKSEGNYTEAHKMVQQYGLYEALPDNPEIADTLLNRFIREKGWGAYASFAKENAKSQYVLNDLKGKADALLAGNDLAAAMAFVRTNSQNPFGLFAYKGLPAIGLRSTQLGALRDWLVTFRQDKENWKDVYAHYLDQQLAQGASIDLYKGELKLAEGKLTAEEQKEVAIQGRKRLKERLMKSEDRAQFKRLMPLVDPDLVDEDLQARLLGLYQKQAGKEGGSSAYLQRYGSSIIADRAQADLDVAIEEREAEEEAAEAINEARKGRHYGSYVAWHKAQQKRVAEGKIPEPYMLPETVNSKYMEFKANETADGKYLYMTRNSGGEDIFMSKKQKDGSWGEAKAIDGLSEKYLNESIQMVTADGTQMLYFNGGKFYYADKTVDGWSVGEKIPESINKEAWQADAWVAADNRTFFFIRKVPTGTDMFVSRKSADGEWDEAIRLPDNLNKPGSNRSPILAGDLKTLYFTSDAHGGEGQADIFYSERLDETYLKWSDPVNLGKWINTENNEWMIRLTPDGERFYYSSNVDENTEIFEVYLPKAVRPKAVIVIEGNVETRSGDGIGTVIVWQDLETGKILQETRSDPADGSWVATLPGYENGRVGYRISQDGYYSTSGNIKIDGKQKKIVLDKPLKIYTPKELKEDKVSLPLRNLFFATGAYKLDRSSYPELDELAELLIDEDLCVEISGHTDNVGESTDNQTLSENRAKAVKEYLLAKGIDESCLVAKGFGSTKPVASNKTAKGRGQNRRVEVRFR